MGIEADLSSHAATGVKVPDGEILPQLLDREQL